MSKSLKKHESNELKHDKDFEEYIKRVNKRDVVMIKALELTRFNKEILLGNNPSDKWDTSKPKIKSTLHKYFRLITDESIKGELRSYNDYLLDRY